MADRHDRRAYENERNRHRNAALKALQNVALVSSRLVAKMENSPGYLGEWEARAILADAVEAHARLQAFEALEQVGFLISESGAEQ